MTREEKSILAGAIRYHAAQATISSIRSLRCTEAYRGSGEWGDDSVAPCWMADNPDPESMCEKCRERLWRKKEYEQAQRERTNARSRILRNAAKLAGRGTNREAA